MAGSALVVVRGGGELGSAAARLLFLCGHRVIVLETPQPLAVRRRVAFAEAVRSGQTEVEGVVGRLFAAGDIAPRRDVVAVTVDRDASVLPRLGPDVLVDARMLKARAGTARGQARLVVGLGPGFVAGEDVHAVVETNRGPDLGRVIWSGSAEPDSARPAAVLGHADERVLRAPRSGIVRGTMAIGDLVHAGEVVASVDGAPVTAAIAGQLRGLVADGVRITAGTKIGDVDPRGRAVDPARVSDKARAVAAGVLEAVGLAEVLR